MEMPNSWKLIRGQKTMAHVPNVACLLFLWCLFVNKILLEHDHVHLFMHCLWLFHITTAELDYNTEYMACKVENI